MPDPTSNSKPQQGDQSPEPTQSRAGASSRKRQRSRSPLQPQSTGPSKRFHKAPKASPKPTGEEKKKSNMYHIKSEDIPEDARGLKRAFEIHIRILWNSVSENAAPKTPSNIDIANFRQRFSNRQEVDEVLKKPKVSLSHESLEAVESLQRTCQIDPGTIASAIAQVDDHSLRMTFSVISLFGVTKWRPDVLGASPTSLYNLTMESIAISSFELGLQSHGYVYFEPNLEYIHNTAFLRQIYRNYTFIHCSSQLMKARIKYTQDSGFNDRLKSLIAEPECNSEDEDADDGSLHILVKNLRSENATHFIKHDIDKGIRTVADLTGSNRHSYRKKPRKLHPSNKKSIFRKLPKYCALDWFIPEQFNSLPPQIRKRYVNAKIALPSLDKRKKLKVADWAFLSEEDFMKKYGNEVQKLYKFPTEEELNAMDPDDSGSDDASAMDEDEE
ncbi:uncharacterized protein C8R40DRAFT_1072627 [Lentinula edodes]|uniref:uncharacterized protein n=1 Tax=Lentinula edodes TaxID=5353 RepID=UPI001E8DDCB3|nr:uncharacterized protein C8R40DRAFT_1072627 [Lentinula edodes]KAH7871330.1 hypothetical protein C8R40DRAFT_1072627 [Lentinula edodes]